MHLRHTVSNGATGDVSRPVVRGLNPEIPMEGHVGGLSQDRGKDGSRREGFRKSQQVVQPGRGWAPGSSCHVGRGHLTSPARGAAGQPRAHQDSIKTCSKSLTGPKGQLTVPPHSMDKKTEGQTHKELLKPTQQVWQNWD